MSSRELIDVLYQDGTHKGVMRRSEAHASLEWHRTFHCWVLVERPLGMVLLAQRRHRSKNRPGRLDAAAGGHVLAGETIESASREIEEELGAVVEFADLVPLGVFPISHTEAGCNNEVAHVFAFVDERQLRDWTFDRHETASLLEVPVAGLLRSRATGEPFSAVEFDGRAAHITTVTYDSFTPFSDPYWDALLAFAQSSALRTKA
jgi:isopentenyldiphosphate isomerase